jgi:hypothetical protein
MTAVSGTQNFTDISDKTQYLKIPKILSLLSRVRGAGVEFSESTVRTNRAKRRNLDRISRGEHLKYQCIKSQAMCASLTCLGLRQDEGLYFCFSVRRRWCCCGRPGCTSSLLIITASSGTTFGQLPAPPYARAGTTPCCHSNKGWRTTLLPDQAVLQKRRKINHIR